MLMEKILVAMLAASTCFTVGCGNKNAPNQPAPDAGALARARAHTSEPAWLHAHMPSNTVAYLRIPSIWTMVGATPTGGPLDRAAVGKQQLAIVDQLRKAAMTQPKLAGSILAPLMDIFVARLDSPLEIALIDPAGIPSPNAHALLVAQLDVRDAAQVRQMFERLPKQALHLAAPLDAQGNGVLNMGARIRFDAASKRLYVLAGARPVPQAQFDAVLAELNQRNAVPPSMARLEPGIDDSGQGLFGWIKLAGLTALAASKMPPALAGTLPNDLLVQADAAAFGAGSMNGHGRIRVVFDAPKARLLDYLSPQLDFHGLKASGAPRWAFTMALPSAAKLQQFEQNLNLDLGAKGAQAYRRIIARLKTIGVPPPRRLAALLGPDMIFFGDASGTYSAVRLRDADAFHRELSDLAKRHQWRYGTASSGKARVHWLSAPSWLSGQAKKDIAQAKSADAAAITRLYADQRTHLFWTEEGDWLIFADVPQALADRAAADPSTSMSDWLRTQRYPASTWIGATAISHGAQREAYYHYLRALLVMGDLLGQPVDIMKLPSATQLELPDQGVIGGGITLTPDTAGIELDYEQLPTELVHGQSATTTVAVVAILAAIAIPQYQDYIIKSQFSESQVIASGLGVPVMEYYQQTGRCPTNAVKGFLPASGYAGKYVGSSELGGKAPQCTITVTFQHGKAVNRALAGKTVVFTGTASGGGNMQWSCDAPDIAEKYRPQSCRTH